MSGKAVSMQDQSLSGLHKTKCYYHQQHYSAYECQVNVSVSCIFPVMPVYRCTLTSCYFLLVVKFLVELVPYLFSIEGVKVFLSERLCQDPLENSLAVSDNVVTRMRIRPYKSFTKTHKLCK